MVFHSPADHQRSPAAGGLRHLGVSRDDASSQHPGIREQYDKGQSLLDGAERAQLLGDVRVRLADFRPGDGVGKVVFTGEDGSCGTTLGRVRIYE